MTEYKRFKADEVDTEGRMIIGYAAAFGNVDRVGDVIERGAFKKTIAERKIKVFYNHQLPIGVPKVMREDGKGLYTESYVSKTAKGDEILELVRDGVISEMSIAYEVVKGNWDEREKVRKLKELKLYEYGPVDFAANEDAVISGVKAFADRLSRAQDIEPIHITRMREELKGLLDAIDAMQPSTDTAQPSNDTGIKRIESALNDLANYYKNLKGE